MSLLGLQTTTLVPGDAVIPNREVLGIKKQNKTKTILLTLRN